MLTTRPQVHHLIRYCHYKYIRKVHIHYSRSPYIYIYGLLIIGMKYINIYYHNTIQNGLRKYQCTVQDEILARVLFGETQINNLAE